MDFSIPYRGNDNGSERSITQRAGQHNSKRYTEPLRRKPASCSDYCCIASSKLVSWCRQYNFVAGIIVIPLAWLWLSEEGAAGSANFQNFIDSWKNHVFRQSHILISLLAEILAALKNLEEQGCAIMSGIEGDISWRRLNSETGGQNQGFRHCNVSFFRALLASESVLLGLMESHPEPAVLKCWCPIQIWPAGSLRVERVAERKRGRDSCRWEAWFEHVSDRVH